MHRSLLVKQILRGQGADGRIGAAQLAIAVTHADDRSDVLIDCILRGAEHPHAATNTSDGDSAISYIPEKSWNDFFVLSPEILDGGGGGPSNCFNQDSTFTICISGNSPKPSWQTGTGVPADGVRDVPDVSLSASNFNDPYVVCMPLEVLNYPNDSGNTTSSCASGITSAIEQNSAFGGTSASAPLMAGIAVLLNQYVNGSSTAGLGLINPTLYSLAGTSPSAFHDTPTGSNSIVKCTPGTPSGQPADVVCPSTGTSAGTIGFSTTTGYDLVTGLGSVDAYNLAHAWPSTRTSTTTSISPSATNVVQGTSVTFTATVTPSTATGTVNFFNNGGSTALGTGTLSSGTATFTTTALPAGTDSVAAIYNGDTSDAVSTSATPAVVTVAGADFTLATTSNLSPASVPAGQSAIATLTIGPVNSSTQTINFTSSSCSGLTGATCSFSPASVTLNGSASQTVQLSVSTAANMALPTGAQTITETGTASGTGGESHTTTVSLAVTATNQTFTLSSTNGTTFSVAAGGTPSVSISVAGTNGFILTSSSTTALALTYSCSGLPSESSCSFSPSQTTSVIALTMKIATTAPTAQLRPPLGRSSRIFYALLLPGLFGVVFATGSRTRTARLLSLIVVLGFFTLWLGACGGSSSSSQKNPGTPAGTYPITVSATTGAPTGGTALTNSFMVTLTVQ